MVCKYNFRTLSKEKREEVLDNFGHLCGYCHDPADEVDHIMPWNYRRDNDPDNLVACCRICNMMASDKIFKGFKQKQAYILAKREKFFKRAIPIWTEEEFSELDPDFQNKLRESVVVVASDRLTELLRHLNSKKIKFIS